MVQLCKIAQPTSIGEAAKIDFIDGFEVLLQSLYRECIREQDDSFSLF